MSNVEGHTPIQCFGSPFIIMQNLEYSCVHAGEKKINKKREEEKPYDISVSYYIWIYMLYLTHKTNE